MQAKKSNYPVSNKENEFVALNMLRKAQKSRKELLERKFGGKNFENNNAKENNEKQDNLKLENISKVPKNCLEKRTNKEVLPNEVANSICQNEFRSIETKRLMDDYSSNLVENLLSNEHFYWTKNCLANHTIPANIRAKMIDWMVEVLCSYKCTNETFFVAVYYLDAFFKNSTIKYEINDLHLVGVVSMFLASKFEEIYPLRMRVVYEKIAHKKFTREEIREKETDMINKLNFNLNPVTLINFIELT